MKQPCQGRGGLNSDSGGEMWEEIDLRCDSQDLGLIACEVPGRERAEGRALCTSRPTLSRLPGAPQEGLFQRSMTERQQLVLWSLVGMGGRGWAEGGGTCRKVLNRP